MKFIKGAMVGAAVTAGVLMVYSENMMMSKKKMMKTGKKLMKKMGVSVL